MMSFNFADTSASIKDCAAGCSTGLPKVGASNANLQVVFNWIFGAVGGIAVIIIVLSALRLVLAARDGDSQAISRLRGTIIYAGIGLAVAILADSIVSFVLGKL